MSPTIDYLDPVRVIRAQRAYKWSQAEATLADRNRALDAYQAIIVQRVRVPVTSTGETLTALTLLLSDKPDHQATRSAFIRAVALVAGLDPAYFRNVVDATIAVKTFENNHRVHTLAQIAAGSRLQ